MNRKGRDRVMTLVTPGSAGVMHGARQKSGYCKKTLVAFSVPCAFSIGHEFWRVTALLAMNIAHFVESPLAPVISFTTAVISGLCALVPTIISTCQTL